MIYIYNNTTGSTYKSTWITTKNQWYFLNSNGNPLTGWQYINGAWYYLSTVDTTEHPYGSMYVSGKTPDGYAVGADGKIKR